jgi:hypothetical protein
MNSKYSKKDSSEESPRPMSLPPDVGQASHTLLTRFSILDYQRTTESFRFSAPSLEAEERERESHKG